MVIVTAAHGHVIAVKWACLHLAVLIYAHVWSCQRTTMFTNGRARARAWSTVTMQ